MVWRRAVGRCMARLGKVRLVENVPARRKSFFAARLGDARLGRVGLGRARLCMVWQGKAWRGFVAN